MKTQDLGPLGRAPASGVVPLRFGHYMGVVHERVGEIATAVSVRKDPTVEVPEKMARVAMAARRISFFTRACSSAQAWMQGASMLRALAV